MWEVIVMTYKVIFIIKVQKTPYKLEIHYITLSYFVYKIYLFLQKTLKKNASSQKD